MFLVEDAGFSGPERTDNGLLFHRDGTVVDVRLDLADGVRAPESPGTVPWSGRHTVTALARSAVQAFDRIDYEQGEESYEARWGAAVPPNRTRSPANRDAGALEELQRPSGFTHEVVFRRCPDCQEHNIVREDDFVCAFCGSDLPAAWNVDSAA
ncbi:MULTISPECIES: hypothetical protein [unclassified Streptomyces]|uniref:hypothetical protein n=1 Tax=unclassified Streptomyces TaxID=2593676 RepID=UPI000A1D7D47|nr:hypothetical protein [Streptomyces sp. 13-12-16]OSP28976.1 hypothetical protein B7767_39825 [Streptomyces sp. 13-12-16]